MPINDQYTGTKKRHHREPLIRIARRLRTSQRQAWFFNLCSVPLSLLVGAALIALLGHNPLTVYEEMFRSAFGRASMFAETANIAIQLLITGISVSLAFRMQFWNIGGEGQIMFGAMAASYFALFQSENFSPVVLVLLMFLSAALAGGFAGLIPAIFKAKWGTNEILFTLMINYISFAIAKYLQHGPWKAQGSAFPKIGMFPESSRLVTVAGIHWGWIFALLLAVFSWIYLNKSKQGYEITVVGESNETARYAGMNVNWVFIRTIFISAALAGIAGFFQVAGSHYTYSETTSGGIGFTAVSVAYLAKLNPIVIVFTSLFIATLTRGADRIQTKFKIPVSAANILIGLIMLFLLAGEFFANYKLVIRSHKEVAHEQCD